MGGNFHHLNSRDDGTQKREVSEENKSNGYKSKEFRIKETSHGRGSQACAGTPTSPALAERRDT